MKQFLQIFGFVLSLSATLNAQNYEWAQSAQFQNYNLNYETPKSHLKAARDGSFIVTALPDSSTKLISSSLFSRTFIEVRRPDASVIFKYTLGKKALVTSVDISAATGDIFIGGIFMETLKISKGTVADSLTNTGSGTNRNVFMLAISSTGALKWKRNISLTNTNIYTLTQINTNVQGRAFYGADYFNSGSEIVALTNTGADDGVIYTLTGTKSLGYFEFDANNNLYVTGAAGSPQSLVFGGLTTPVTLDYACFLAKISPTGQGLWTTVHNDITFQRPHLAVMPNGNGVYWAGTMSDSVSFGSTAFPRPYSTPSFFLVKTSANGVHEWAKTSPSGAPYTGKATQATSNTLSCDANSNVYFAGLLWGKMDWGNGIVSNPTAITTSRQFVFTKFAPSGTATWTLIGGSNTNAVHSISTDNNGIAYFSGTCNNGGSFGNFNTTGAGHTFVFGKINTITANENTENTAKTLILYPNPTNGRVYLQDIDISTVKSIKISDIYGRIVANPSIQSEIDLAYLPKGVYFVQILVENSKMVAKMIIE
jgi:hypothetical protein